MNKIELFVNDKEQLLRQLRASVFFQKELWATAASIEDTLNDCQKGPWDAVRRLEEIRDGFGEKIVDTHDVEKFTEGFGRDRAHQLTLEERQKTPLRQKLQKALWIQNELWKTATMMAQTLGEPVDEVLWGVRETSILADSGCELIESDLDVFLDCTFPGTVQLADSGRVSKSTERT
jgi:hypothetical protein